MKASITLTLYIISGWASQYRPGIMPEVVANRQAGRAIPTLPQALPDVAGFVAGPYCHEIGNVVELSIGDGPWERYLIADCPHNQATRNWMLGNNICYEFDYKTVSRLGFVGRGGIEVRQRFIVTRDKRWPVPEDHIERAIQ